MIAPATIDAVKERADIVNLVREVLPLRKSGASFVGLCPFHKEKTPSFNVNAGRNFFYCHGCKEHGGPIDFVMKNEGLSFPDAVRELAGRLGINIEEGTARDRAEVDRDRRDREALYTVNSIAAQFFERALWGERTARGACYAHEELDNRNLRSRPGDDDGCGAALTAFRIGYAPAAWRALAAHLERQRIPLATAERAGLLIQKDGRFYDRFRHRLMFPVFDHLGRVVAFSGRTLPEPLERDRDSPDFRVGEKPAKYVNSPETPIYKKSDCLFGLWQAKDAARSRGEALLVEGNFDVLALHARGLTHAVAPLGTAFTEAQARLLRRFAPAVVIAFDGDAAGRKATWEARVPVRAGRLDARALALPAGADPDSFVQKHGPTALEDLARHAPDLREHLIRWLLTDGKEGRLEARAKRVGAVVKLLGEESDPTLRALVKSFADRLSGGLVVDGRAPRDLRDLELALRKAMRPPQEPAAAAPETPLADPLGFEVVAAILDVPSIAARADVAAVVELLGGDLPRAARAAEHVSADAVLADMPEPLRPHVERRMAAPLHVSETSAVAAVLANGERLRARRAGDEAARLRREISLAESAGMDADVDRLLDELDRVVGAVHL